MFQLHVPLQVASLHQRFATNVTLVSGRTIRQRMMMIAVLIVESYVLVEVARITESSKAVSALKWLET